MARAGLFYIQGNIPFMRPDAGNRYEVSSLQFWITAYRMRLLVCTFCASYTNFWEIILEVPGER